MTQMTAPPDKLGAPAKNKPGTWVQTERKAHEAWANLIAQKPRAAMLLHHLVAQMGHQNAVVVSQKTLAKLMGIHERTVRRAVADLVEDRWIAVIRIGSGNKPAVARPATTQGHPSPGFGEFIRGLSGPQRGHFHFVQFRNEKF